MQEAFEIAHLLGDDIQYEGIPQIHICFVEKSGKTYLEVADNGIGIEEEYQQRIFRIFQRLNKKDYDGTGIGLAICKKIVELYGGEIGVESVIGKGTKVYFHFPINAN